MPRLADRRARIELLRAAEAAFTERGLAAARVEDITERAGVSKGAFYLHFQSKDDCFKQIVETFIARLAGCVEPPPIVFESERASINEYLKRVLAHDVEVLEFCWQNRALLKMMLAGGGGAPYAYLIDEFAQRVARQVESRVRYAMDIGLYRRDIESSVIAALISGAFDRLVRKLIDAPSRPDIGAWCGQVLQLFTHGLLAPEVRAVADPSVMEAPPRSAQQTAGAASAAGSGGERASGERAGGERRRSRAKAT
ncbi:TetR/AcrR family transcriptional regulator [Sorangium cellulosum]|uniref:AcrR family transcriptional regulator n=1 Tax=Sorangium cellulosum TaxID=56 RepID=A0A150QN47_SORCE|nr:TetR/AcrR family transcriptional regulator [Sorangium cellulosum]KYF69068.1 AcrR family transcriptional regulator [Sorangium cellulosum]